MNAAERNNKAIFDAVRTAMIGEHIPSLAQRAGVSYGTLYHWHHGYTNSPRLTTLLRVAQHLNIRIEARRIGKKARRRRARNNIRFRVK